MTYALGQPVRLVFSTYSDAARTNPADPTAVALDILSPDGTTATYTWAGGQVIRDALGVFHYDAAAAVAGHYAYHWSSTGTIATALDGSFDVAPEYGKTLVSAADFSLYLNDSAAADDPRAAFILGLAQTLCETIVKPLPDGANLVILDVAQRAYANPAEPRGGSGGLYAEGQGPYSTASPGTAAGGLYLTRANETKLRQLGGVGGGAFSIDMLPATLPTLPPWDSGNGLQVIDLP